MSLVLPMPNGWLKTFQNLFPSLKRMAVFPKPDTIFSLPDENNVMNPFLIGITIFFWALFLVAYLMSALSDKRSDYILDVFIFFIFAIFLTIACGTAWHNLHYNNTQPPAIEQHK